MRNGIHRIAVAEEDCGEQVSHRVACPRCLRERCLRIEAKRAYNVYAAASDRQNLTTQITAGAEVKKGDLLYKLERGSYEADVAAKPPNATLTNNRIQLARAQELRKTSAGT